MKTNNFSREDRKAFRNRVEYFLHPSGNVSLPTQLKGRVKPLGQMLDCFETTGAQAFIWGPRGVGKTSLAHTACEEHKDNICLVAAVACDNDTSFSDILNAIYQKVVLGGKLGLSESALNASFSKFGFNFSTGKPSHQNSVQINDVNTAAALLNTIFYVGNFPNQTPTVIIDEFDLLENEETFKKLSSLLKQITVDDINVQFIFCGVADDLNELLGAHESVERYVYSVQLPPLTFEAISDVIDDIEREFDIYLHRGQRIRISQISSGYAGFTHLILKNILVSIFDMRIDASPVSDDIYKIGVQKSAEQAATRLKTMYEDAIKQGTDRYIEVLWALAHGQHFDRQFKDIVSDYEAIMEKRTNRNGYDAKKNNGSDIRNALKSLTRRKYLEKGKSGWYSFRDPMFRSYVRLMAEQESVELGNESFPA